MTSGEGSQQAKRLDQQTTISASCVAVRISPRLVGESLDFCGLTSAKKIDEYEKLITQQAIFKAAFEGLG